MSDRVSDDALATLIKGFRGLLALRDQEDDNILAALVELQERRKVELRTSKTMTLLDAPPHYNANEASAWANGYTKGFAIGSGDEGAYQREIAMLRENLAAAEQLLTERRSHETFEQPWVWEFGLIHFHTIPGFADRLREIVIDCQQASVIADIWLNDFGQVLKEYGYKMTITKTPAPKASVCGICHQPIPTAPHQPWCSANKVRQP